VNHKNIHNTAFDREINTLLQLPYSDKSTAGLYKAVLELALLQTFSKHSAKGF